MWISFLFTLKVLPLECWAFGALMTGVPGLLRVRWVLRLKVLCQSESSVREAWEV